MDDSEVTERMYASVGAPLTHWTRDDIQQCRDWLFAGQYTDQELSDVFALIDAHRKWVGDKDIEPGKSMSEEEFEDWDMLSRQAEYRVVHRFMPKYGYFNSNGWWIKKTDVYFENEYEVTAEQQRSIQSIFQKRSALFYPWYRFLYRIMLGLFIAYFSFVALSAQTPLRIGMALAFLVLFVREIITPLINLPRQLEQLATLSGKDKLTIKTSFGETIRTEYGNSVSDYSYDQVRYIEHNKDRVYLWLEQLFVLTLYKNSFTHGDVDSFLEFITAKCSEQEPLWTQSELNKRAWRKNRARYLLLLLMVVFAGALFVLSKQVYW
ncbi:MAG: hypothetical protein FWD45_05720 [Coriobacteriia bacterium]|nr:hypothetical protein [Coriobacteriia bacterium]